MPLDPSIASHPRITPAGSIRAGSNHDKRKATTMSKTVITKDEFVAVLDAAGVTQEQKHRFHAAFERRHPQAHQAFLEWLGVSADEVRKIREWSRA